MSPKAPITAAQYLGMSTTINPPRSRLNVREFDCTKRFSVYDCSGPVSVLLDKGEQRRSSAIASTN
jgi:hypothetical protein